MEKFSFGMGRFALVCLLALVAVIGAGRVLAQDQATPVPENGEPADQEAVDDGATIVVVERAVTDTRIDLGAPGESIGDMNVFANAIYDETNTTEIGGNQGTCFLTNPDATYECSWTLFLDLGRT